MFNKKLKDRITELEIELEGYKFSLSDAEKVNAKLANLVKGENEVVPWANHEMTPEDRYSKAKELISNPLMIEIFMGIEEGLTNQARNADLSNHIQLMSYTQGLQILEQMIEYIESRVNDQKVVEYNQKVVGLKH